MTCKGSLRGRKEGRQAGRKGREAKEEKGRWGRGGRRQDRTLFSDWIETMATSTKAWVAVPIHTVQKWSSLRKKKKILLIFLYTFLYWLLRCTRPITQLDALSRSSHDPFTLVLHTCSYWRSAPTAHPAWHECCLSLALPSTTAEAGVCSHPTNAERRRAGRRLPRHVPDSESSASATLSGSSSPQPPSCPGCGMCPRVTYGVWTVGG